jgi:hypothetical protein
VLDASNEPVRLGTGSTIGLAELEYSVANNDNEVELGTTELCEADRPNW